MMHPIWSPADFQALLDLAAEFPSEVGESQMLADLVDEAVHPWIC